MSPVVGPGVKLPYDNYDEWWIDVQDHTALRGAGLCSHGLFALAGLASREDAADSSWDLASMHDSIAELQQRFWTSFWQSKAQMYVADGDLFNFVCRDRIIFNRVLALANA